MAEIRAVEKDDKGRYAANFKLPLPLPVQVDQSTTEPAVIANISELIEKLGNKVVTTLKNSLESLTKTTASTFVKPYIDEFTNAFDIFSKKIDSYFGNKPQNPITQPPKEEHKLIDKQTVIAAGLGEEINVKNNQIIGLLSQANISLKAINESLNKSNKNEENKNRRNRINTQHSGSGGLFDKFKNFFSGSFDENAVGHAGTKIFDKILGMITGSMEKIVQILFGSITKIISTGILAALYPIIQDIIKNKAEGVDIIPAIMVGLGPIGGGVAGAAIGTLIGGPVGFIVGGLIGAAIGAISRAMGPETLTKVLRVVEDITEKYIINPIATGVAGIINILGSIFDGSLWKNISNQFAEMKDQFSKLTTNIVENITQPFINMGEDIANTFIEVKNSIFDKLAEIGAGIKQPFVAMGDDLINLANTAVNAVVSGITSEFDTIKTVSADLFKNTIEVPVNAIKEKINAVSDVFSELIGKITGFFDKIKNLITDNKLYKYFFGSKTTTPEAAAPATTPPVDDHIPTPLRKSPENVDVMPPSLKTTPLPKLGQISPPDSNKSSALDAAAQQKKKMDMAMSNAVSNVVNNKSNSSVSTIVNAPVNNTYSNRITPYDDRLGRVGMG